MNANSIHPGNNPVLPIAIWNPITAAMAPAAINRLDVRWIANIPAPMVAMPRNMNQTNRTGRPSPTVDISLTRSFRGNPTNPPSSPAAGKSFADVADPVTAWATSWPASALAFGNGSAVEVIGSVLLVIVDGPMGKLMVPV